jgi:transposase-like protein
MATASRTTDGNRSERSGQAFLLDDAGFLQEVVRRYLQEVLETEMSEYVGARRYERTGVRRGYRSGHRPRMLGTRLGRIDLAMPTERSGGFKTELFDCYQRSEQAFMLTLQEMYLQGVSTRRVRQITEKLCGTQVSASTVSRLERRLDADLEAWRNRRLVEEYRYLVIDARYERVRVGGRVTSQGVLQVVGISASGQRDIIGVMPANTESEASWTDVFRELARRGLRGVRLVVSDDHEGLVAAVRRCFQGAVVWQRCQKHFLDNVLALVGKKDRAALRQALRTVFDAASLEHAQTRLAEVVAEWRERYPEVADKLEEETEDTLAFFHFPSSHWLRIRTTNMLERYNGEVRRRTNVIRVFPNMASCLRLVTAHAMEQAAEWAAQTQYLDMSLLEN